MPATAILEHALSALPGGYLLLDDKQQVRFASARFYQLLHCAPLQYGQALPASLLPQELEQALQAGQAHASQQLYGGQLLDWLLTPLPDGTMVSIREDRQTFRNLIENSPDIISRYDKQLVCLYANSALARYSPIPPALHIGLGIEERGLPAHVCDAFRHASNQVLASGKPVTFENQLNHHDKHYVFESRLFPETDEQGQVQSLLCIDRDISEEHAMRLWQADENRLLEMIANDRPMKEVMVWTCHMIESQIEGSMCSIMLLDDEGLHLRVAAGPSLPDEYKAQIDGVAIGADVGSCGTAAFTGEAVIVTDIQQHPYWAAFATLASLHQLRSCWSYPIKSHDGRVLGTFAIYFGQPCTPDKHSEYITLRTSHLMAIAIQQERRASQLFQLATQDSLTGLYNRRHFMTLAEEACANTSLLSKPLCMLMFDLDHFKQVNDRYGHAAGDEALRSFARILQDSLRAQDLVCRMGGEEFAALLTDTSPADAVAAARRICRLVAETPVLSHGQSIALTVSIGLTCRQPGQALGDMMRLADKALYEAKNSGRNRVHIASHA